MERTESESTKEGATQGPHAPSMEKIKRLLCSLSLVVAVYTSTWFITFAGLVLTEIGNLNRDVIQMIQRQLGWLVIINASSNFFIYFWRAPEYRKAFLLLMCCGHTGLANRLDDSRHTARVMTNGPLISRAVTN
ncbi:hypothetical protein Y032_0566g29 [Ancylostoma ceylanicum]|uniref:G-protein coupled receptors family 1 profile domain-containing protein n=1 Tax=Ancylostoma ceylanicum TaxID=53326 RepID=A0A016WPP9_9BILA|nr:hypothetical protein Y032_0566g29 [Ancylostoma ceylanicum]